MYSDCVTCDASVIALDLSLATQVMRTVYIEYIVGGTVWSMYVQLPFSAI